MKRLLCAVLTVALVFGLCGCFQPLDKDGMVYEEPKTIEIFNVDNKDVFDTGYYGMQFKYDDNEQSFDEKITVTVYFKRLTDFNSDWEVYVTDHELVEDEIIFFDNTEPDLYNEANMEIVSGQWIYVRCSCNSDTSAEPSNGSFTASYYAGTGKKS